eukprot:GHVU01056307.1.p1 GENE.GHVU01056307.1~~GHVU01056307.1.p1  ORF type:complete len:153 (-),score=6.56 GHVU01056307.1:468-926(-)
MHRPPWRRVPLVMVVYVYAPSEYVRTHVCTCTYLSVWIIRRVRSCACMPILWGQRLPHLADPNSPTHRVGGRLASRGLPVGAASSTAGGATEQTTAEQHPYSSSSLSSSNSSSSSTSNPTAVPTAAHCPPMLSLNKACSEKQLQLFHRRASE